MADSVYFPGRLNAIGTNISNKNDTTRRNNYSNLQTDAINVESLKLSIVRDFKDSNYLNKDFLDQVNVYKDNKVIIKWMKHDNGLSGGSYLSGDWTYISENDTYKVKNRQQYYNITSSQPVVTLTSPFIWTGKEADTSTTRCCGFNYIPPNESIGVTATLQTGESYIMNFIPSNPNALYPILKSGEISISGYGNNFIHWGQSDKITIYCKSNEGEYDRDDNNFTLNKENCKKNLTTCELEININANDRFIEIIAEENCSDISKSDSTLNIHQKELQEYLKTTMVITPTGVDIASTNNNSSSYYSQDCTQIIKSVYEKDKASVEQITGSKIEIQTDEYVINSKKITINSEEETTIHSDDKININVPVQHPSPHPGKALKISLKGCHVEGNNWAGSVF